MDTGLPTIGSFENLQITCILVGFVLCFVLWLVGKVLSIAFHAFNGTDYKIDF